MAESTGEFRSPLEVVVCIRAVVAGESVASLGVLVAQDRVLCAVARPQATMASFEVQVPGQRGMISAEALVVVSDDAVTWALLKLPVKLDIHAPKLDEGAHPGAECYIFQREGDEPVPVLARMAYLATVDPVQTPLLVRPVEPVAPERLVGSPCIIGGQVVGVLSGCTVPERPHLLKVIPAAQVVDRCSALKDSGLQVDFRPHLPPPQWPRFRVPMVAWYDPGPLLSTGINILISQVFGEFDDRRAMEGGSAVRYEHALECVDDVLNDPAQAVEAAEVPALWIDYIADTGDGFDSTYAVASAAALPWLPLKQPDGRYVLTKRGHLLVFGGDQVYPLATASDYRRRFITPFRLAATGELPKAHHADDTLHPWTRLPPHAPPDALPGYDPRAPWQPDKEFVGTDDGVRPHDRAPPRLPWVVSLPGNHDWYDNLVQFMKIFASGERFAEWNPVQSKSYFAKRLPWGWWIFGVDVQLTGDIDPEQLRYFLDWVDAMRPGDRAILCVPEPHWLDEPKRRPRVYLNVLEAALQDGDHLKLWLAGDLHHYRRHESSQGTHKIVAGGGGAFLHATHPTTPIAVLPRRAKAERSRPLGPQDFELKESFPPPRVSRLLAFRNLLFPFLNWRFALLLGALYLIAAWLMVPGATLPGAELGNRRFLHEYPPDQLGEVLRAMTNVALVHPPAGLFLLVFIGAIRSLSNTPNRLFNWVAGITHGVFHVIWVFLICWLVAWSTVKVFGFSVRSTPQLLVGAPMVMALGALVGGMLMGMYLWASSTFFGLHQNEAFSSIRNPHWKCFLRLRVRPDGLTIYPIGMRRVPRGWRPRKGRSGPVSWPAGPEATRPFLIEAPIELSFPAPRARVPTNNYTDA